MKKIFSIIISITFLSSCTNIMEQKATTKMYEDYKIIINKVDSLDLREKEYIIEQSQKMIIEIGIKEKAMEEIGLKIDPAELFTFREFFTYTSDYWRKMNNIQKNIIKNNILIDSTTFTLVFLEANSKIYNIRDIKATSRVDNYSAYRFSWEFKYDEIIEGTAQVTHNINELNSFIPDRDLTLYGSPIFHRKNDSVFYFKSKATHTKYLSYSNVLKSEFSAISRSDLNYWWESGSLPPSSREEIYASQDRSESLLKEELVNVKFNKLTTNNNFPKGRLKVDNDFLTQKEYNEIMSIYNESTDPIEIKKLKVKYGINH